MLKIRNDAMGEILQQRQNTWLAEQIEIFNKKAIYLYQNPAAYY